jgi:hypothetical protein
MKKPAKCLGGVTFAINLMLVASISTMPCGSATAASGTVANGAIGWSHVRQVHTSGCSCFWLGILAHGREPSSD